MFLITMLRLKQGQYTIAISMLVNGAPFNAAAQYFNVHRNTILRVQTRVYHYGTVCNRERSVQSCVTTPAQDR